MSNDSRGVLFRLNFNSHEILSEDDLARIDPSAFFEDIRLVACRIEMNEQKLLTAGFQRNSSCQGRGEVSFHFFIVGEGTFQDEEVDF